MSAGGAPGREAREVLIVDIVSAGCTLREVVHAGLVDLIVMLIAPVITHNVIERLTHGKRKMYTYL